MSKYHISSEKFINPPALYRFHILEHSLVDMDEPQLYIDELIGKGVCGFVINHTWGNNKYLKDRQGWYKLNKIIRYIKDKGLHVWLYDEDGFPSGSAGGLTLEYNPEYEALGITVVEVDSNWTKPDDLIEVIYSFFDNGKKYTVCTVKLYEGSAASCNYARRYINIADKHAVDAFIANTYDAYKENVEDLRGDIDAIFTDEPGLMEAYIVEKEYKYAKVSWTPDFEKHFEELCGYELMPVIKHLFWGDSIQARITRIDYRRTLAKLVSQSFFENVSDWCERNGIKSSGHCDNEEFIHEHVAYYGNLFTTLDKIGIIGFDVLRGTISRFMEYRYIGPKFVGSLARIRGKAKTVMVELCPIEHVFDRDYEVTDEQLRAVCNILWMCGANYINSYRHPKKLSDPQAFSDYVGRMGYMLSGAVHDEKIAVYYPIETMQALYAPLREAIMSYRDSKAKIGSIEENLREITLDLWRGGRDFDVLDAIAIEQATIEGDRLHIAGMDFKTIIMPNVQVIPVSVLKKLKQFEDGGGRVIWSGCLPIHGVSLNETAEVSDYAGKVELSKDVVKEAIQSVSCGDVWTADGELFVSRFKKNGNALYMLINNNQKPLRIKRNSRQESGGSIFRPLTGSIETLSGDEIVLEPFSAVFFMRDIETSCPKTK